MNMNTNTDNRNQAANHAGYFITKTERRHSVTKESIADLIPERLGNSFMPRMFIVIPATKQVTIYYYTSCYYCYCHHHSGHGTSVLFVVVVLRPSNIYGHIRTGTDL